MIRYFFDHFIFPVVIFVTDPTHTSQSAPLTTCIPGVVFAQSLLSDPNPNSPANVEAAKLFQENRREYDRRVIECVELSWDQD